MVLSFDFGASTTDMVLWKNNGQPQIKTFETLDLKGKTLAGFLNCMKISLAGITEIRVTGGRSRFFPDILDNIPVRKIDEIKAIGCGGAYLLQMDDKVLPSAGALVASLGTGSCFVKIKLTNKKLSIEHIGGTGIGGGTFLSLADLLLKETNINKLIKMFNDGDRRQVDISVAEIIGGAIGLVPGWGTASNLGKIWQAKKRPEITFTKNDLAAGLANLIGQTIATAAVFAARAENLPMIILTGKLTKIKKIMDIIFEVGKVYDVKVILPKKAEFVSALGVRQL